jgi:hypothetical protein
LLVLFSCDKRNTISNSQKVILPKKIAPANHQAEKFKHKRGKKTIITILGAKCSSCIHEMKIWKQYFEKGKIDRNANYYFIAEGNPNFYFKENVYRRKLLQSLPIFIDKDSSFVKNNQLNFLRKKHTLVLNNNNRIVFVGSPYLNKENITKINEILN